MTGMLDFDLSPEITLSESDHRRLTLLALIGAGHSAEDSDFLLWELDRARLVPDHQLPANVVRVGSVVRYRDTKGQHTARLVHPDDRSTSPTEISVLSPVGTALLGLRKGQSITWMSASGERRFLTLLEVINTGEGRR